jgi:hypothetical protein
MAVLVLLMAFVSASKDRLTEMSCSRAWDIAYCWQYVLNMSVRACVCVCERERESVDAIRAGNKNT